MLNCIYHFTWYWTALAASIWLWLQKSPDWRSALVFLYKGGMPNIAVWPQVCSFWTNVRFKVETSSLHAISKSFSCNGNALQITSLTVKLRNCWETPGDLVAFPRSEASIPPKRMPQVRQRRSGLRRAPFFWASGVISLREHLAGNLGKSWGKKGKPERPWFSNKTSPSRWLRSGAYGYHLCKLKPIMPPSAGMKFAQDSCRNCAKNIPKKDIGSLFWGTSSSCNPKRTCWTIPIGGCWFPVLPRRPLKAIKSRWLDARSPHVAGSPRPGLCQRDGPVPAASRTPGDGSGTWEKLRGNHGRSTTNLPSGYVKIAMERSTMLLMGKSTTINGHFQ